jgi:hypothetical protein
MLALKKLVVWFTLVCFLFTATGCAELGIHAVPIGDSRTNYSLNPDEQANADQAAQVFNSPPPQEKPLIYDPDRPSEARAMLKHFKAVAKQYRGRTGGFSESEKQEIVDAILPLANYLAAVEETQRGIYVVPPGQTKALDLEGYCLDKRKGSPQYNEKMRLVPVDTLTGAELKPIYQKLLIYARNNPKRVNHADMQGILWGIREIANGHNTQSRALSDPQEQILMEAAPEAASILQRMQMEGRIKGIILDKIAPIFNEATKKLPFQVPIGDLINGQNPQDVIQNTAGNAFGNQLDRFFNRIPDANFARQNINNTIAGLTGIRIEGVQGQNGEYTLLSPNVAAKTNAAGHIGARIEIANHSAGIFPFEAESCVAQSQRSAQRIALQPLAYTVQVNPKDYKKVQGVFYQASTTSTGTFSNLAGDIRKLSQAAGVMGLAGEILAGTAVTALLPEILLTATTLCLSDAACREAVINQGQSLANEAKELGDSLFGGSCQVPDPNNDDDKQKKGRPKDNKKQNKQVNDVASKEKLNTSQREQLGREVENESRHLGENLSYHDILEIARDIKNGVR